MNCVVLTRESALSQMRNRFVLRCLLAVLLFDPVVAASFDEYVAALRREMRLSTPEGNHTALPSGLVRASGPEGIQARSLLFAIAPRYVLTVQEALGSMKYINDCALKLPKTLPRHFVLAAWVLKERYLGHPDSLWRLWLETLPPLEPATLWGSDELKALEDGRVLKATAVLREQHQHEFDSMVRVVLEDCGLGDDLPDMETIGLSDYIWALAVVHRHAWYFAPDFPVLVPVSLRFHINGNSDIAEWGDEQNPGAALYVGDIKRVNGGDELTGWMEAADNQWLLLHAGYVHTDISAARMHLQLSAGGTSASHRHTSRLRDAELKRERLLRGANYSREMNFEVMANTWSTEGASSSSVDLNVDLMTWLRLVLASPEEVMQASSHKHFSKGRSVSLETARKVHSALLAAINRELGRFDHALEEDDALLEAASRTTKSDSAANAPLSRRAILAIEHRRLAKLVLLQTQRASERLLAAWSPGTTSAPSSSSVLTAVDAWGGVQKHPSPAKRTGRSNKKKTHARKGHTAGAA